MDDISKIEFSLESHSASRPSKSPKFTSLHSESSRSSDQIRINSPPIATTSARHKVLHPIDRIELSILLLENISQDAVRCFKQQGFKIHHSTCAWSEDELVAEIGKYHAIGIRSKTKISRRVLDAASKVCLTGFIFQLPYPFNSFW